MHHWIYYASLNEFMHQLDINWIYASWNEFLHRGMNLCINLDLLTGALSFFVNIVGTCFVIAPGHRWLVNTLCRGWLLNMLWCIVNDLWMRRHNGFWMTYECVVVCVADLLIRHVLFIVNYSSLDLFSLCRGWLLNMLWCIVNDLWMRRHIGFRMTHERVMMCVAVL